MLHSLESPPTASILFALPLRIHLQCLARLHFDPFNLNCDPHTYSHTEHIYTVMSRGPMPEKQAQPQWSAYPNTLGDSKESYYIRLHYSVRGAGGEWSKSIGCAIISSLSRRGGDELGRPKLTRQYLAILFSPKKRGGRWGSVENFGIRENNHPVDSFLIYYQAQTHLFNGYYTLDNDRQGRTSYHPEDIHTSAK